MSVNLTAYRQIQDELNGKATLVAVSKTKPAADIQVLYDAGHRDFGENYVQELTEKQAQLPADIRWHFIGHLQSNKVKYIAPFVHLVHGVDSENLLKEINKQAVKCNRTINSLLQVHIAREETKFGFDAEELNKLHWQQYTHAKVCGLMGMASFTEDQEQVRNEFKQLRQLFDQLNHTPAPGHTPLTLLSMGMSGDYRIALEEGSNMVRIGSLLFGARS
jgi:pyridoxal phosphate enzyme (YggS family)